MRLSNKKRAVTTQAHCVPKDSPESQNDHKLSVGLIARGHRIYRQLESLNFQGKKITFLGEGIEHRGKWAIIS